MSEYGILDWSHHPLEFVRETFFGSFYTCKHDYDVLIQDLIDSPDSPNLKGITDVKNATLHPDKQGLCKADCEINGTYYDCFWFKSKGTGTNAAPGKYLYVINDPREEGRHERKGK